MIKDKMTESTYHITGLDCPNCAKELQDGIAKLGLVDHAQVDFVNKQLIVTGDADFASLQQRAREFGNTLHADKPIQAGHQRRGVFGFWDYLLSRQDTRFALIGFGLVILGGILTWVADQRLSLGIYTLALALAVYPLLTQGLNALRINRRFTIDLLMSIAAIGALLLGEYLEAATIVFLYTIGEALEGYVTHYARDSIATLLDLQPRRAWRISAGHEEQVTVDELAIGDHILIKPGERIPMDGVIVQGDSAVNQAAITGESMPVHKISGDEVFAGSINHHGLLTVAVSALAQDNTLNRIVQMVAQAQSRQAPSQRIIDRFAQYYTPAVIVLAVLIALIPTLFFGQAWIANDATGGWLYRALTILVIACPCALVISTPVTIISAISRAAQRGILIKGGAYLEQLGTVQAVAFDKTGTLTQGRPQVTISRSIDCESGLDCPQCDDVLALAAALESRSTHPLAQAVVRAATSRRLAQRYPAAQQVKNMSGQGIMGMVDEQAVVVGSHALFDQHYHHSPDLCQMVQTAEAHGQTTMLLHDGERVRGFIALADTVREHSAAVLATLHDLHLTTVMLTGDNAVVAQAVADELQVQTVRASLLPQDKVQAVQDLVTQYHTVMMVGDGINDTPALAQASIGVAMGGAGSAQAMETADIVLMADDLSQLPFAIRLSRFARMLIMQNITLAIITKLLFLLLATSGGVTMWMAIFADVGMSLLVILNGMRALRFAG